MYQIWGEPVADKAKRVPVISFTVQGRSSKNVVEAIEEQSEFGCRWGCFYSNRLCEEVLGLDAKDGVIRVSLVHYNTSESIGNRIFSRISALMQSKENEIEEYIKQKDSLVTMVRLNGLS